MRSFLSVALGVLISLCIGLLVTFGILWPIAMRFLSPDLTDSGPFMLGPLVLVAAFAFYFGGMAAAYTSRWRPTLHGFVVPFVSFGISPALNTLAGEGPFPGVDRPWEVLLIVAFLAISAAASLLGARRGGDLYRFNSEQLARRLRARAARGEDPAARRG